MNQFSFPTTCTDTPLWLEAHDVAPHQRTHLETLADRGYRVQIGLTREDALQLSTLSQQPLIRTYARADSETRFKDYAATEQWLAKGRLVFLLKPVDSPVVAGYGWTGPGTSPYVPAGTLTGGLRLSELHQGRGLARPFLSLVLAYTQRKKPNDVMWFGTWQSNEAAVHIYETVGFTTVADHPDHRLTLDGKTVDDVRLFMQL